MAYFVKDWKKFQHFKDRRPPWIKLYRDILDDLEWFELTGDDAKMLVMLWIIASEDINQEGELPSIKTLEFKLRMKKPGVVSLLGRLSHWLIQDDISAISAGYQDVLLEKRREEKETETETKSKNGFVYSESFLKVYAAYPNRCGRKDKAPAYKFWLRQVKEGIPPIEKIIHCIEYQKATEEWQEHRERGQPCCMPKFSTYISQRRWEDVPDDPFEGE